MALGARSPCCQGWCHHPHASCCLFLVFASLSPNMFSSLPTPARVSPLFLGPSCPVSLSVVHRNMGRSWRVSGLSCISLWIGLEQGHGWVSDQLWGGHLQGWLYLGHCWTQPQGLPMMSLLFSLGRKEPDLVLALIYCVTFLKSQLLWAPAGKMGPPRFLLVLLTEITRLRSPWGRPAEEAAGGWPLEPRPSCFADLLSHGRSPSLSRPQCSKL